MTIKEKLDSLSASLPSDVKLVAVSKMQSPERILEAYSAGHRRFGENKVQELIAKMPVLPKDIEWHFIGHLQTNKVKFIAPFVHVIQSIDSLKLLMEVDQQAENNSRVISCLLELYIASEETKYGLYFDEAEELLKSEEFKNLNHVKIVGVMGMATFTDNTEVVEMEFRKLREYFDSLSRKYFSTNPGFREISMGMSSDFRLAIKQGSTMVRIGSAIFKD